MMHKQLAEKLAVCLGDTVSYKLIAQGYHWNVKGPMFPQYHKFFQKLYEDADSAVDPLAENIRKLGFDSPFTLEDFSSLTCLHLNPVSGDPIEMSGNLYIINKHLKECLTEAFDIANKCNEQGIADFLAGRIDLHAKYGWQLSTIVGADSTVITRLEL
jgi:starvation-inducible DNA-binding protein